MVFWLGCGKPFTLDVGVSVAIDKGFPRNNSPDFGSAGASAGEEGSAAAPLSARFVAAPIEFEPVLSSSLDNSFSL